MKSTVLLLLVFFLTSESISAQEVKCGDALSAFEGILATASSKTPIINKDRGSIPEVGQKGELLVRFESEFFGSVVTGTMVIAKAEIQAVTGNKITLKVLEELSIMTVNGKKKNHFRKGREAIFQVYNYEEEELITNTYDDGTPSSRGLKLCGTKVGQWEFYYKNGDLRKSYFLNDDGKAEGKYKEFHPNGQLAYEVEFDDGDKEGPYTLWYPNGIVKSRGKYDWQGERDGLCETFYESGKKKTAHDTDRRTMKKWYENGQISEEGSYDYDGLKDELWKEFYEDGKPKSFIEYDSDEFEGSYKTWYSNGNIHVDGTYDYNSEKHDSWVTNYENGNPQEITEYRYGKLDGDYLSYYENGQIKIKCEYMSGEMRNEYTEYHANGNLKVKGKNYSGEKTGTWEVYFEDGELQFSQHFKNDEPAGKYILFSKPGMVKEKGTKYGRKFILEYTLYYDSGSKKEEGEYSRDGVKEGKWTSYFEDGKVSSKGEYTNGKKTGKWLEHNSDGKKVKIKY